MYAGVHVPNLSGTFKKFRSLNDPAVAGWKCTFDVPKLVRSKTPTLHDIYIKGEAAIEHAFDGGDPIDYLGPWLDRNNLTMDHVDRAYKKYEKCKGGYYAHIADMWDGAQHDAIYDAKEGHFNHSSAYYSMRDGKLVPSNNPWR